MTGWRQDVAERQRGAGAADDACPEAAVIAGDLDSVADWLDLFACDAEKAAISAGDET